MNPNTPFTSVRPYRDAPPRDARAHATARALGWFSIGLGLAELVRPRSLAEAAGLEPTDALVRTYGARELATGVGLLTSERPEPWMWGRVVGDVLDVATVGASALRGGAPSRRSGASLLLLLGVTAIDLVCASALRREARQWRQRPPADYRDRTGFPRGATAKRGTAPLQGADAADATPRTRSAVLPNAEASR